MFAESDTSCVFFIRPESLPLIMLKKSMPTEAGKGGPAILDKVIGIVNEMLVSHSEIAGICISTAGMVDTETGSIFYSAPLIPNYAGTQFKKILEENEERFPLLTLDEFFNGNTEEDSIAPNQWEFGRPTLSEIWDMLQKIELMPNIAWVRVALHDDTEIVENNGAEELVLAGDSIVICTTILPTELEKLVNCEWLCSDGVITIKASELNIYSCVPPIPENFNCLEIVWD